MKNGFIALLLSLFLIFAPNLNVYALSKNIQSNPTYTIDKNQVFEVKAPYEIAEGIPVSNNQNEYSWIASIFIVGLGQMIMGDFLRGLTFTAAFTADVLFYGYTFVYTVASYGGSSGWAVINFLLLILIPVIYFWDLIDAYRMSNPEQMSKSDEERLITEADKFIEIAKRININNNGVSVKLLDY
jgi:hypothetical protein